MELEFPKWIVCHGCGGRRWVRRRELFELPSGMAGIVWARCRKCRHTFVRFVGEKGPASKLMEQWLGLQEK